MRMLSLLLVMGSTILIARGADPTLDPPRAPNTVAMESRVQPWPEGVTFLDEKKGLPFDVGTPNFQDGVAGMATGYRILDLTVQPGETVRFKLKAEDDKVSMRVHIPNPPPEHDWYMALRQADKPYLGRSRPRMVVKNETKVPQSLGLIIFGHHGCPYRVDLERIPSGK